MPFTQRDGAQLFYRVDGDPRQPQLVLVNSLGTDTALWDNIIPLLTRHFYVLRTDKRGHGHSSATPGDYSIEMLARDVLAVMDAAGFGLDGQRSHYAGVSIGGMIGQWLGAHAAERFGGMVFSNTSSKVDSAGFAARMVAVQAGGMVSIVDGVMQRWFTPRFIAQDTPHFHTVRNNLIRVQAQGYVGCCAALRDMDLRDIAPKVSRPALVIIGSSDLATPPDMGHALADSVPGAQRRVFDVGHLAHVEAPARFVDALARHCLPALSVASEAERFEAGMVQRKSALGADYVDARVANAVPFNESFQRFITRMAWGEIWTAPGISHRDRRLFTLAMVAALGRWDEFRLHTKAGLAHELDPFELEALLMQVAVYCGVPTANTAFHHALELLKEAGRPEATKNY
jgi:3-oxoadipate enol-lactonase / 4-carboxymuconolactone decarboxylase